MTSYLAIQAIQIRYTDDHRGRVDAERRERIRALPLAAIAGTGVLHECRLDAWRDFEPKTMASGVPLRDKTVRIERVNLRIQDDALAFLDGSATIPLFATPEDHWARVVWNTKQQDSDAKWLVELVVNAGLFAGPPSSQVFFGTPFAERDLRHDFVRAGSR